LGNSGTPGSDDLDVLRLRWLPEGRPVNHPKEVEMYPFTIRDQARHLPAEGSAPVERKLTGRRLRQSSASALRTLRRNHRAGHQPDTSARSAHLPAVERAPRVDPDAVLGAVFHAARLRAGLTCDEASRRSGLSPTRIIGIEDGDGLLVFADAIPLAEAYGQSLYELSGQFERALRASMSVREVLS
jgi:hypothetical protein